MGDAIKASVGLYESKVRIRLATPIDGYNRVSLHRDEFDALADVLPIVYERARLKRPIAFKLGKEGMKVARVESDGAFIVAGLYHTQDGNTFETKFAESRIKVPREAVREFEQVPHRVETEIDTLVRAVALNDLERNLHGFATREIEKKLRTAANAGEKEQSAADLMKKYGTSVVKGMDPYNVMVRFLCQESESNQCTDKIDTAALRRVVRKALEKPSFK